MKNHDTAAATLGDKEVAKKVCLFLYALEKKAASESFVDFMDNWGLSEPDYREIKKWFIDRGITGYITK
jgi:hypothetical protein